VVFKLHVISGLPRSGSTLLAALLRQNPRFAAGMTSPVASLCSALHQRMGPTAEFSVFYTERKRRALLRSVLDAYYEDVPADHVVFDTNRSWTSKMAWLAELYPDCRVICCVREVGWIIDSIERMMNKNPLHLSRIFDAKTEGSVYSRVEILMNSERGLIGSPWSMLREAWFGDFAQRLIIVPYESLCRNPAAVMNRLYAELKEEPFAHDFDNVVYDEPDYDADLGMPGMHTVQPKVEYRQREPGIPPDLFAKYADTAFWARPDLNRRGVKIL